MESKQKEKQSIYIDMTTIQKIHIIIILEVSVKKKAKNHDSKGNPRFVANSEYNGNSGRRVLLIGCTIGPSIQHDAKMEE